MKKEIIYVLLVISILLVSGCETTSIENVPTNNTVSVNCVDGVMNTKIRYQNTLSSALEFGEVDVFYIPKSSQYSVVESDILLSNGGYSSGTDLPCKTSGIMWTPVAITKQNEYHSVEGDDFITEGAFKQFTLKGKAYGDLQVRVKDNVANKKFFTIENCGGSSQQWVQFTGNVCEITNNIDTGLTLDINEDDFIDSTLLLKTIDSKKQFGEDDLKTYMLVDANNNIWQEPIVGIGRDELKSLGTSTILNDYDKRKYSGYDYVYEIKPITDRETQIDFYLITQADINPTSNDSPIIDFCSEGRYNSMRSADTIKIGCWNDASTQSLVSTSVRHSIKFMVG